jgi:hypothetical protein
LQYDVNKRISWQDLCDHPYILEKNYHGIDNDLSLTYVGDQKPHQQVLANPYRWMNEHKDDVYELNTRNSDKFDELY